MNVRFQYKAVIRVDCSERLLSSVSGHKVKPYEQFASDPNRTFNSKITPLSPILIPIKDGEVTETETYSNGELVK